MLTLDRESSITTREKVLRYLLLNSSYSNKCCIIKEIAIALDLSDNSIRKHLVILEKERLIVRTPKKGVTGRPAMLYTLHEDALETFPKVYAEFFKQLFKEIVEKFGETPTQDLLEKIGIKMAKDMQNRIDAKLVNKKPIKSLKQKLEYIIKVFEEYDRFPELIEDNGSFSLKNYNCLLYNVIQEYPLVCVYDQVLIDKLIGRKTTKVKCISWGDTYCLFRVKKEPGE